MPDNIVDAALPFEGIINEFLLSSRGDIGGRFEAAYQDLFEAGISLDKNENDIGGKALSISSYCGNIECVEFLLKHNVDLEFIGANASEMSNRNGSTPLIYLLDLSNKTEETICSITSMLLEAGANIDAQNNDGRTALMNSVVDDREDHVKMLLEAGADFSELKNNEGKSAEDIAVEMKDRFNYFTMFDLIEDHKNNLSLKKKAEDKEKKKLLNIKVKSKQKNTRISLRRFAGGRGL